MHWSWGSFVFLLLLNPVLLLVALVVSHMSNRSIPFLSWNVRCLGQSENCAEVKCVLGFTLQNCLPSGVELDLIPYSKSLSFLPPSLLSFVHLPSVGAVGGVITAWCSDDFTLSRHHLGIYSLTTWFHANSSDLSFATTNVYGPNDHHLKSEFLDELTDLATSITVPWTILGDFNIICYSSDHSHGNFDHGEATLFND